MISTVTTSTVTTVALTTMGGSLILVGIIVLLTLLVQKELASNAQSTRALKFSRALGISIVPLLIGFAMIVATKVIEVVK